MRLGFGSGLGLCVGFGFGLGLRLGLGRGLGLGVELGLCSGLELKGPPILGEVSHEVPPLPPSLSRAGKSLPLVLRWPGVGLQA